MVPIRVGGNPAIWMRFPDKNAQGPQKICGIYRIEVGIFRTILIDSEKPENPTDFLYKVRGPPHAMKIVKIYKR